MAFNGKIKAVPRAGIFQRIRAIDEKHHVVNVVSLSEFNKKLLCKNAVCSQFKLCAK